MKTTLGFIGTGNMGLPIARNLLESGHPLRVFNRTAAKAASLAQNGATLVPGCASVADRGGIVLSMLSDDEALEEVAVKGDKLAMALGSGGIHVSMGTVSPAAARRVAAHHEAFGVSYLAAPVFGRPEAAAARNLWICLSGPEAAKARVEPILRSLGRSVTDFGADPGAANVVKLAGNFLLTATVEAMSEMLAFGEKNGIERRKAIDFMTSTLFSSPVHQIYGKNLVERRFEPPAGFRLEMGLKDIGLVLQTASSSRTPMPMANIVRDRMLSGMAKGRAAWDMSSLSLGASEDAGIENRKDP